MDEWLTGGWPGGPNRTRWGQINRKARRCGGTAVSCEFHPLRFSEVDVASYNWTMSGNSGERACYEATHCYSKILVVTNSGCSIDSGGVWLEASSRVVVLRKLFDAKGPPCACLRSLV